MTGIIRVGIAGLGRAGWGLHAHTLAAMPDRYRVAAVCDAEPARRAEAEARLGCRAYADLDGLLADGDIDLAVVAMPSHLHADAAVRAMRAGKHVLVEKPFATSLADADRMLGVARATGRLLTGGQNQRYAPDFLKVREVIVRRAGLRSA
jgi:predicted dehydrogenase